LATVLDSYSKKVVGYAMAEHMRSQGLRPTGQPRPPLHALRKPKPNCRCKANLPVHGPYLHWTRTVNGKTVTQTLTDEQARRFQLWFDNARRLRQLTAELEARSLRAFDDRES
jgi:hypothetical protein